MLIRWEMWCFRCKAKHLVILLWNGRIQISDRVAKPCCAVDHSLFQRDKIFLVIEELFQELYVTKSSSDGTYIRSSWGQALWWLCCGVNPLGWICNTSFVSTCHTGDVAISLLYSIVTTSHGDLLTQPGRADSGRISLKKGHEKGFEGNHSPVKNNQARYCSAKLLSQPEIWNIWVRMILPAKYSITIVDNT